LRDSTLVAQRIQEGADLVCTPDYLDGRNLPFKPHDLREHQCVLLNGRNNEAEWALVSGRKSIRVPVSGPVSARDHHAVSARGHGIWFLPSTFCDARIARGELIRLLPEWSSPEIFIHTVYPTRRFLPSRLQVFLEALKGWKSPLWIPLR
jgi:DNA-binding transcriptional LysR family regulator